jgi:hypothetical protein
VAAGAARLTGRGRAATVPPTIWRYGSSLNRTRARSAAARSAFLAVLADPKRENLPFERAAVLAQGVDDVGEDRLDLVISGRDSALADEPKAVLVLDSHHDGFGRPAAARLRGLGDEAAVVFAAEVEERVDGGGEVARASHHPAGVAPAVRMPFARVVDDGPNRRREGTRQRQAWFGCRRRG